MKYFIFKNNGTDWGLKGTTETAPDFIKEALEEIEIEVKAKTENDFNEVYFLAEDTMYMVMMTAKECKLLHERYPFIKISATIGGN